MALRKWRPNRDCDGNGNTNEDRADRAQQALLAYAQAGEYGDLADESVAQDLLCDLQHWFCRERRDFKQVLADASDSYNEEA